MISIGQKKSFISEKKSVNELKKGEISYIRNLDKIVVELDKEEKIYIPTENHNHNLTALNDVVIKNLKDGDYFTYDLAINKWTNTNDNTADGSIIARIDDNATTTLFTWSSQKIQDILNRRLSLDSTILSSTDKAIYRANIGLGNSATRNIGTTELDVAAGYHTHDITNIIGVGNSATRNVGTLSTEVAAGNHNHILASLSDISINTLQDNQLLWYNGFNWINKTIIIDNLIDVNSTWSSNKLNSELIKKVSPTSNNFTNEEKQLIRVNIGLGDSATRNVGTTTLDVAAGYHEHVVDHIVGLGDSATRNVGTTTLDVAAGYHEHVVDHIVGLGDSATKNIGTGADNVASAIHGHSLYSLQEVAIAEFPSNFQQLVFSNGQWINSSIIDDSETVSTTKTYSIFKLNDLLTTKLDTSSILTDNNKSIMRNILGLGNVATKNVGTGANDVAVGNHNHNITTLSGIEVVDPVIGEVLIYSNTTNSENIVSSVWKNGTLINDSNVGLNHIWSSSKVYTELTNKVSVLSTNFSDGDKQIIRDNLGLGNSSTKNVGTLSTEVASGDHNHLFSNLSDVTITGDTTGNILLYNGTSWINHKLVDDLSTTNTLTTWSSAKLTQDFLKCVNAVNTFSTTDQASIRVNLGLGDSSTKNVGYGADQVAAGEHAHLIANLTDVTISASPLNGQFLTYTGSKWENITYIPPAQFNDAVTNTSFSWSSSYIQTKLDERLLISDTISYSEQYKTNARANLSLGDSAVKNVGTASTEVAVGNHLHSLDSLSNITISGVNDNDVLVYSSGKWNNKQLIVDDSTNTLTTWSSTKIQSRIDELLTYSELTSVMGVANGIAKLDVDGKIDVSQLSKVIFTDVYTVADIDARDLLVVESGDIAVISSTGQTFIYNSESQWVEVLAKGRVSSINGRSGNVVLTSTDVGLENIVNSLQLVASNNLSDVNPSLARESLGIGPLYNKIIGTGADNVASGDHKHYFDNSTFLNVTISSIQPNQVLMYNSTISKWENKFFTVASNINDDTITTDLTWSSLKVQNELDKKYNKSELTTNFASLVNGKLLESQLPPISISDVTVVVNEGDKPTNANPGDICNVTGTAKTYIYKDLTDGWIEITQPGEIVSVNGYSTPNIVLNKNDIGLTNIVNQLQLVTSNNLSDLTNPSIARTNLGLGEVVTKNFGTGSNDVARGNHTHIASDISDIVITTPMTGQILKYNSVTGKWANSNISSLVSNDSNSISTDITWSSSIIDMKLNTKVNNDRVGNQNLTGTSSSDCGIASLVNGKIPQEQLPPITMSDVFVVNNVTERNALTAQTGDIAVVTSESKTYIYKSSNNSWIEITSSSPVKSVNGRTGSVIITKADVGLDNVVNVLQMIPSNNLSDLTNPLTARANLGLTEAIVTAEFGMSAGQVAEGNHTHGFSNPINDNAVTTATDVTYSVNKLYNTFIENSKINANNGVLGLNSNGKVDLNKLNGITLDPAATVGAPQLLLWDGASFSTSNDIIFDFGNLT
jgi:DNA-directed RNA polymerase subunit H (RpoH/RPB5)